MYSPRGYCKILPLKLIALCAISASLAGFNAYADTYTVYAVYPKTQGNVSNLGITDQGQLVNGISQVTYTYSTFTPPSTYTTSATLPALTFDNGSSCSVSQTGVTQISMATCNGGRAVFQAFSDPNSRPGLFLQQAGAPLQLLYSDAVTNILLNSMGDIAFTGLGLADGDTNYLYYDVTSHAAPEPSSLMLLGTGALGLIGVARRRLLR